MFSRFLSKTQCASRNLRVLFVFSSKGIYISGAETTVRSAETTVRAEETSVRGAEI